MPSALYSGPILTFPQTLLLLAAAGICIIAGLLLAEQRTLRAFMRRESDQPLPMSEQERQPVPQESAALL